MGVTKRDFQVVYMYVVCYITSRDGGVTQGDFRRYRCRRDPEQYSTDQSPPGLLGTYKRLDGIKGCEYRTSWHWVDSIYCTNLNRHVGTQGTEAIWLYIIYKCTLQYSTQLIEVVNTYDLG